LGPEAALAIARREQLAVYLISRTEQGFEVQKTPAIEPWLE
jgi:thiamine biosynthesis lipoprotein ApbE